MYYPFPSDRIDSPSGTVDITGRERRVYGYNAEEGGRMAKSWNELTVCCIIREERPNVAIFRRVSDCRAVERVDDGGGAENV
jgi:hypothetical protein